MTTAPTASEVLDREFLEIRAKILELAACFDRLDRAAGSVAQDPRVSRLRQALEVLKSPRRDRAEQVQLTFSRTYETNWREQLGVRMGS